MFCHSVSTGPKHVEIPKFNLQKAAISLLEEGQSHKAICSEALPIPTHVPNLNARQDITYERSKCK